MPTENLQCNAILEHAGGKSIDCAEAHHPDQSV